MKEFRKGCLLIVLVLAVAVVAGCRGQDRPLGEKPVQLPPVPPTAAMATISPSPTATPPPPTVTPTPQPEPTPAGTATPTPTPEPTAPLPTPTEAVEVVPIGRLGEAFMGQEAVVEGEVVAVSSFSAGFRFTLDDGTGQVVLLMWHTVYDDCWDAPQLNLGARVRARGTVGQYQGTLQLEPEWGGAVKVLETAEPTAEPRAIGSLTGADEGRRVMIEGEVVRTEGGRDWVKVFLRDETGEIPVFIWRSILDRIPQNTGLGVAGSRVRVVGVLSLYRSNLEVSPALPYDVEVLASPSG